MCVVVCACVHVCFHWCAHVFKCVCVLPFELLSRFHPCISVFACFGCFAISSAVSTSHSCHLVGQ
jgi:hypothetical protein